MPNEFLDVVEQIGEVPLNQGAKFVVDVTRSPQGKPNLLLRFIGPSGQRRDISIPKFFVPKVIALMEQFLVRTGIESAEHRPDIAKDDARVRGARD